MHLERKESNWYKNEEDLAPRPNNPYTQLYVMYRALYECSTSHSGTVKDVAFMLGCIEASGELPTGIRPIRLDKYGNSASDITARLRDLFYRGYIRRDAPVDDPTEKLNYNMPYTKTVQLERAVWRIATREEFEEVAALYIRKTARKDKKYRDARRGIKREVRKVAQGVKDFAEHATDLSLSSTPSFKDDEYLDQKLAYEQAKQTIKTKETLKAQALEEVKAEIKASQIKALKYALTFGAGAGIAFILTLLGKIL